MADPGLRLELELELPGLFRSDLPLLLLLLLNGKNDLLFFLSERDLALLLVIELDVGFLCTVRRFLNVFDPLLLFPREFVLEDGILIFAICTYIY